MTAVIEFTPCSAFALLLSSKTATFALVCPPTDKLLCLLPEYVIPCTIHLLAHDPDYVKVQDIEQLKDIKE